MGLVLLALLAALTVAGGAWAQSPVGLGTTDSFAVLGGSAVTNTGPSVINGDLGVNPGTSVTGFPPGTVNGTIHEADAVAAQAQSDLTIAYNDAAGRACDQILTGQDLGGLTLTSGVYCFAASAGLTGTVTLNAQGDPNAVFIFQIGSTLITASNSNVNLINGAQACNVFWQVGSSATLGTTTTFVGNVLALTSISANTGATVDGRLLARNGAVTLDSNTVTRARCAADGGDGNGDGDGDGNGGGGDGGGDDKGPIVEIDGASGDGISGSPFKKRSIGRDFKLRITAHDKSGIRSVKVLLDGQRIKKTNRRKFAVWINAEGLRAGRHTIRVVARDRVGNRTVKKRRFKRSGRPSTPNFTG